MPFILTYIRTHFIDVIKHAAIVILVICSMTDANAQQELQKKYKDSIRKLKSQKDFSTRDTLYIDLLNELGSQLRYYNTDSLLLLSKEALQLSIDSGYKEGECRSRLRLGDYFSDKGDSDKAIYNYKVGHEIAKELGNKDLSLRIINNLAGENAYKGDYAHALTGYLEAIEIAEEIDDKKMLSIMNENIANLYASQKDYEQSLDFYKKVKKINGELGNEIIIAETLSNLASVYADMGKLDYAMFNINSSVGIFEKHKIIDWLAFTYEIKGKIYLKENKYKWALYWYNQSELLHRSLDDDRGKIDLYNGMAEAYLGQGKDSISEKIALQAYAISDRIQFMEGTQKCAYTLYRINKNKKNYSEALNFHELYQKLSDTLSRNENKKSLTMLKTKTEYDKQKQTLIAENEKALAQQQRYIIAALAILVVFIIIIILVYRAEKIQKRLNKELEAKKEILEKRESELQDSNETKTKLFSIIGHDLRGPVGALQELLRLYSDGDIETDEFLEFVPKLREDVDHISFTLNNLLSWGHTQMNGAVTKPSLMALESLVSENIKLLSEIAKKKSIKIVSELVENTLTWSDSNQIDIVVRNLISNALKFTPQNGMITISARERDNLWEVSIKDTGVGMDKITVKNLFEKNSNITTYGTANEKGTGLGLALCKEMVEKNGGSIWVESALRKGSCFFFTLPKREKSYSQAV
ncbi:MAG: tetratricopeptide repeat-containing sensor histidine kinase [Eudoraea sp.]|uniref:tetratricopeptide repeat-containing sensor histidine kinase n=1 Tax=Eudoraea sp. TaxID=1979955 RepID=UPI003C75AAEE